MLLVLKRTLKKVTCGIFVSAFGEFCAVSPINLDITTEDVTVQAKEVAAIAQSVRAIQEEICCDKLNSVVAENAQFGYHI